MALKDIPFAGLASLEADERIPFGSALACDDCWTDDDSITGRSGARNAITASAAIGAGLAQCIARYRPSPASARTVAVRAGQVFQISDPTAETAIDGTATSVATPFGATAAISAAQLNKHLYIGSDEATVAMRRMDSSYTLSTMEAIPQGDKPTVAAFGTITFTKFMSLAAPGGLDISGCSIQSGTAGLGTDWRAIWDAAGTGTPANGAYVKFNLGANFDASAYDWLVIAVTPNDGGGQNTAEQVEILLGTGTGVAGSMANAQTVGVTHDVPPVGGSPNLLFVPLSGLAAGTRSAIRFIQFLLSGDRGGKFGIYGYAFLPGKPLANPQKYYVTFYNAATGQESPPTEALEVTIRDQDKLNLGTPPTLTYPACWLDRDNFKNNGGLNDILSAANNQNFNRQAGKAFPTLAEIGAVVTINGTTPAVTGPTLVRLWKDTREGRRLVTTAAYPGASSAYSLTDTGGLGTLANSKFRPGGTPPRCNAMAARAGRIITAWENRISISSYVAPDATSSPFPQFPAIALEEADGWAFDIAPSNAEQVQSIVDGDLLYIATNMAVRSLNSLVPGTLPHLVSNVGTVGRYAACYGNKLFMWAARDGIYAARGRADEVETTVEIRRLYREWFAPTSATVLAYQYQKLLAFCGTKLLRFDFVKKRWSRHTLGFTVVAAESWTDPTGTREELWLLTSAGKVVRWQDSATSDDGTAIPNWTYKTGFDRPGLNAQGRKVYIDTTGTVRISLHTTTAEKPGRVFSFPKGEFAKTMGAGLTGYKLRVQLVGVAGTKVRAAMWERAEVDKDGVS